MTQQSFSFTNEMWKRLKKNKGALFGLVIIILAVLIAVFGYLIAPDSSPNADLQTVEIQARKPGYTQLFLKIPDKKINNTGWLTRLFTARRPPVFQCPCRTQTGGSGEGSQTCHAVSGKGPPIRREEWQAEEVCGNW